MNTFTQHIPSFVDQREAPKPDKFSTTEELLELQAVKQWKRNPEFSHFAMKDNALMAILDDGFSWWVVGFIKHPEQVNLPQWEGWKFRAELPNGDLVKLGDEVISSCGAVLKLRDGTTARNLAR